MKKRLNFKLKSKLESILMKRGAKKTSEKILTKSFKALQRSSLKQSDKLVQLGISLASPTFKIHKLRNKNKKNRKQKVREIPFFIVTKAARAALAIKLIKQSLKRKFESSATKLAKEILLAAKNQSEAIDKKALLHESIADQKLQTSSFFRWS